MKLSQYPALHRALCAFHGRTVPGDIEIPRIWQARFRLSNEVCEQIMNAAWFATVTTRADLDRITASTGHVKVMQQVFFEWELRDNG
jgi:hypothetical protein